jgi:hypothetical protein
VVFDLSSPSCEIYDILDKKTLMYRTNLAPRSILLNKKTFDHDKDAIIQLVDDDQMFQECLFFDTLHRKSIFHYIFEKQVILEAVIEKVLNIKPDMIPFLMFKDRNDDKGKTFFDLIVEKKR